MGIDTLLESKFFRMGNTGQLSQGKYTKKKSTLLENVTTGYQEYGLLIPVDSNGK